MTPLLTILLSLLTPQARLKVRARGFASLDEVDRKVLEHTHVLKKIFGAPCTVQDGCLLVDFQWAPPRYVSDAALEMSLKILKP